MGIAGEIWGQKANSERSGGYEIIPGTGGGDGKRKYGANQ